MTRRVSASEATIKQAVVDVVNKTQAIETQDANHYPATVWFRRRIRTSGDRLSRAFAHGLT